MNHIDDILSVIDKGLTEAGMCGYEWVDVVQHVCVEHTATGKYHICGCGMSLLVGPDPGEYGFETEDGDESGDARYGEGV